MVEAGLRLFRRQGYTQTSWRELVQESGTPWGSIHHFFPQGKVQLATDALSLFGSDFRRSFEAICAQHVRPSDRIRVWFQAAADEIAGTGYAEGCPLAGIALNSVPMEAPLSETCLGSLSQWTEYLAQKITNDRIDPETALRLATKVLIAFEGALVLSRIRQSSECLTVAGEWMAQTLEVLETAAE